MTRAGPAPGRAEEMASVLTLADVEQNNSVVVLVRSGFLCREIAPVIDRVEAMVREFAGLIQPMNTEPIRCVA